MARVASAERLRKALSDRNFQADEVNQIVFDARRGSQGKYRRINLLALEISLSTGHGLDQDHVEEIFAEVCRYDAIRGW